MRQTVPFRKALRPESFQYPDLGCVQAGQVQEALQIFRHLQDLHMITTAAYWCEVIDALARQRQKGTVSNQLPRQLWRELCDSGLHLDARSYVTGQHRLSGIWCRQRAVG